MNSGSVPNEDHEIERQLVLAARDGDRKAFQELYLAHVDVIHRYIDRRVARDAEDLTADVFVRAYRAIGRYEWRGVPFRAWLIRIAANIVANHHARTKRAVPLDDYDAADPSHEDTADRRLEADEILHLVHELPDVQCQTVVLRFVEGLSAAEVAAVIGTTEEAVRAATYRGLKNLRVILEDRGFTFETARE